MRMRTKTKSILAAVFCILYVQNLVTLTDGNRTFRIRSKAKNPSTEITKSPEPNSQNASTIAIANITTPIPSPTLPTPRKRTGRRRVRVRKVRVHKRQGFPSEEDFVGRREPLFEDHQDEVDVPSHYYSPIRRQRMKMKDKLFKPPRERRPRFRNGLEGQKERFPGFRESSNFQQIEQTDTEEDFGPTHQPAPKNYAFAYAVGDDENSTQDFSHKEARDGKLTHGEYRINLPDGRTQVVRYTAGGNIGYKADVTYEGEGDDTQKQKELRERPDEKRVRKGNDGYLPPSLKSRGTLAPKKYIAQNYDEQRLPALPPEPTPAYHYQSPQEYQKSSVVEDFPVQDLTQDERHQFHSNFEKYSSPQTQPFYPRPVKTVYATEPPQRHIKRRPRPSVSYDSYPLASPEPSQEPFPEVAPDYDRPKSRPRFHTSPAPTYNPNPSSKTDYPEDPNLSLVHDKSPRAGPKQRKQIPGYGFSGQIEDEIDALHHSYKAPQLSFTEFNNNNFNSPPHHERRRPKPHPTSPPSYNEPSPTPYYGNERRGSPTPKYPSRIRAHPSPTSRLSSPPQGFNYIEDDKEVQRSKKSYKGYTPINFQQGKGAGSKGLRPVDEFKAGPTSKSYNSKRRKTQNHINENDNYELEKDRKREKKKHKQDERYKEPYHYYNSQHPSYHHGGYIPPSSGTSYTIDFPGGKHSFYLNRNSPSTTPKPFGRHPFYEDEQTETKRKKVGSGSGSRTGSGSGSGLVYFETPGVGPRPTESVQDMLSQLPYGNPQGDTPDYHQHQHQHQQYQHHHPGLDYAQSLPTPQTTIHPYEIGAKDYGQSVGYKNSFNTPASGEAHNNHNDLAEYHQLPRDYLLEEKDQVVHRYRHRQRPRGPRGKSEPSSTARPQFHVLKSISPSPPTPASLPNPFSTVASFHHDHQESYDHDDLRGRPQYVLSPSPSPTPSQAFILSTLRPRQIFPQYDFTGIDPRNAAGIGNQENINSSPEQQEVLYQYQSYEDSGNGVK